MSLSTNYPVNVFGEAAIQKHEQEFSVKAKLFLFPL
jgi:hypothetical protein